MRFRRSIVLTLLIAVGMIGTEPTWISMDSAQQLAEVAFVNVNVIPMDSPRVLTGYTVRVRGDRIVEVGPAARVKIPDGARHIDGRGKYLLPGLGEMHGHIPPPQAPPEYVESVLFLYLANGVTTVRGMLGAPGQLELREKANRGEILSPTLYLAGPSFSGTSVKTPEEAIQRVRQQKQEGWDMLKIHPGLSRDAYDAMVRTAREVGLRWVGHVPADVGLVHALEMGQETIDHLDGYIEYMRADSAPVEKAKLDEVVRLTKQAGAAVVPTMALWEVLIGARDLGTVTRYPELVYMPKPQVESWTRAHQQRLSNPQFDRKRAEIIAANRKELLKALHAGGVTILFGTDAPQQFSVPGFSIHREMQLMRECGMTPYEILRSATKNIGDYFKAKDAFGTVEAGKRADLILLNGNPLEDITQVANRAGVMVRGRWLSETEIQRRLEQIAAQASR